LKENSKVIKNDSLDITITHLYASASTYIWSEGKPEGPFNDFGDSTKNYQKV